MYESSRVAIDETFALGPGTAAAFLAADFLRGDGIFGFRNQLVAVDPAGLIVATATVYEGSRFRALSMHTMRSAWSHFRPADVARIIRRTAASAAIFPPPRANTLYLANFCVRRESRSTGLGAALLAEVARQAQARAMTAVELDVAFTNPRAQAMYERNGFTISAERKARRPTPIGGIRRLTRPTPTAFPAA
jgi:ribosomal protein S18 acetylase RimI-like enzyme